MNYSEQLLKDYPHNVPVAVAARLLGKPVAWVQAGLEGGMLPFGCCVKKDKASFHIAPRALGRYLDGEHSAVDREVLDAIAERTVKVLLREFTHTPQNKGGHHE